MPIPSKKPDEDNKKFISRCMDEEFMKKDYPDSKQRVAVCLDQIKKSKSSLLENVLEILGFSLAFDCVDCDEEIPSIEEITVANIIFLKHEDYLNFGENSEEYSLDHLIASEYQGKTVTLNKPFRTPKAKKKFAVYVRNGQGKVVIVRFGSQEMSIKRDDPDRRRSFRARHKCDQQKDKTTPAYWSCYQWRSNSPVAD